MREELIDILANYFHIGDSYHFILERIKEAFGLGTMGLEDFREYDEDDVAEIAECLIQNGVTIPVRCRECIDFEKTTQHVEADGKVYCGGYCYHWDYESSMSPNYVDSDDFCSYGRKENK